jgi:hypothetical protein
VLGAVKIVRPVGRCILTAPALRQRWPAVEEPRDVINQTVTAAAALTISSVWSRQPLTWRRGSLTPAGTSASA